VTEKQKTFLEAYMPLQDNLWRYCLFMTKNRDKAKDLLGETVAIAYEGFNGINEQRAFLSWLFTVASRIYYKMQAKKLYDVAEIEFESQISSELNSDFLTDISFLYENLNKLQEEQKEAIILFNIEGFTRKEIADIQKVSEEKVKSRLARGKQKLAKLMGVVDE